MKRLKKTLALALFAMVLGISGSIAGNSWTQNAFAKERPCERDFCSYVDDECHNTDVDLSCDESPAGGCSTGTC